MLFLRSPQSIRYRHSSYWSRPVVRRCCVQRIVESRRESYDHRRIRTHSQSGKTKRGADSGYRIRPTPGRSSVPPWQPSIALQGTRRVARKRQFGPLLIGLASVQRNLCTTHPAGTARDLVTGDPVMRFCCERSCRHMPTTLPLRRLTTTDFSDMTRLNQYLVRRSERLPPLCARLGS